MDSNKEESERCIRLAEKFLQYSDIEQALKYLYKAERLYPSQRAKELLDGIENPQSAFSYSESLEQQTPAQDVTLDDDTSDVFRVSQEPLYTDEQLTAVKNIRQCKNYYEILGVDKACSDDDLKKSYRKLALKFHPDKNRAPGAAEAFKAIGSAFGVLSNPSKRRHYDQGDKFANIRSAPCRRQSYTSGNDNYDFMNGFEDDISPEELFRMFFGATFQPANRPSQQTQSCRSARQTRRPNCGHRPPPPVYRPPPPVHHPSGGFLLQISPIIFLVILSLLSTLLVTDSAYSLHQNSKYSDERSTQRYGITYFVRPDFELKYPADGAEFRRVEMLVEDEHVSNLQYHCYRERSHRENLLWRARLYHNDILLKQAKDLRSPSCDALQDLRVLATGSSP